MQEPQVQEPLVEPEEPTPIEPEPTPESVVKPEGEGEGEPQKSGKEPAPFEPSLEEIEQILRGGDGVEGDEPLPVPSALPAPLEPQVIPEQRVAPPQEQVQAPQIPAEVLAIKPSQFMPQGEAFDQMDAMTYGTASYEARHMAELAQQQKMSELAVRQGEHQKQRTEAQSTYNSFVQTHPDMKNNPVNQQSLNEFMMTGGVIDGTMISLEEAWAMRQFIRNAYRPAKAKGGGGNKQRRTAPAPITSVPRAAEPQQQGDAQKWADNTFGPEN